MTSKRKKKNEKHTKGIGIETEVRFLQIDDILAIDHVFLPERAV